MESKDFPILHQVSSASAVNAQKRHFLVLRTKIATLLVIAAIASVNWGGEPDVRMLAGVVSAIFIVVSMTLSALMDIRKSDQTWFSSRAIAESVKKESWRFMMKAEPYDGAISDSVAEERFLDRMREILDRQSSALAGELGSNLDERAMITECMKQVRKKPFEDRRAFYAKERIHDQKLWYTAKAKWNRTQQSRWFLISWILQIAAAALALALIKFGDVPMVNPVGILTTAGAGVMSWVNARNYREISQSYGLVAHELTLLEAREAHATTEEKSLEILEDVEGTISREHTIWLARRM